MSPPKSKLCVACVGGGIGGLTLASALSRFSEAQIQVNVYESAPKLTQVGAGITLWPRAWEIIKELGLDVALKEKLGPGQSADNAGMADSMIFRKGDQKEGVEITTLKMEGGSLSFHRADVQDALLSSTAQSRSIRVHLNHRLTSYEETTTQVILHFENGIQATCDLLVGADGINSVVRRGFLVGCSASKPGVDEMDRLSKPVWSGTYAYRSLIESPLLYCGKNKHIVVYPILQGKFLNTLAFLTSIEKVGSILEGPAMADATNTEILPHFAGWEPEVQFLVENMNMPSRWALQTLRPLEKYAVGRVALVGDSAHAMEPHLGNGASQSIEDAYILSHILSKAVAQDSEVDIAKLLSLYSKFRQPFANFVQEQSRVLGRLYEFDGRGFESYVEGEEVSAEKLQALGEAISEGWEWSWRTKIADDLDKALSKVS